MDKEFPGSGSIKAVLLLEISEAQARYHPRRSVITRAIGSYGPCRLDVSAFPQLAAASFYHEYLDDEITQCGHGDELSIRKEIGPAFKSIVWSCYGTGIVRKLTLRNPVRGRHSRGIDLRLIWGKIQTSSPGISPFLNPYSS